MGQAWNWAGGWAGGGAGEQVILRSGYSGIYAVLTLWTGAVERVNNLEIVPEYPPIKWSGYNSRHSVIQIVDKTWANGRQNIPFRIIKSLSLCHCSGQWEWARWAVWGWVAWSGGWSASCTGNQSDPHLPPSLISTNPSLWKQWKSSAMPSSVRAGSLSPLITRGGLGGWVLQVGASSLYPDGFPSHLFSVSLPLPVRLDRTRT